MITERFVLVTLISVWFSNPGCWGLFPQESETREIKLLDGLWNFRPDNSSSRNEGLEEKWYTKRLKKVP